MANNGNETVGSDTSCTKQTDCFVYCDTPNAINEDSPKDKFFHKILNYLMRSTTRIIQSKKKKFNIRKRSASTPYKSEENASAKEYASLSSIVDNIIKSDTETVAKIEQKTTDVVISTTRSNEVFDEVTHEHFSGIVGHFVQGASYQYAEEYIGKSMNNVVPERGCGPLCIGIGTQSDIVDGKFSLKTSSDAFAKACEERRHADFILKEIAKVSDALMEETRLVSAKEQAASILASVSVTSTKYEMGEETFESREPLISSIIHAEGKPIATVAMTVIQSETPADTQALVSSSSCFALNSRNFSTRLDELLDTPSTQVIPSIKHLRESEHTRIVSAICPERDNFQVTAVTRKKKKEEKELLKKITLSMLDKHVFTVDKTNDAAINSVSVNRVPKIKKSKFKSLDLYQPNDIQTDVLRREVTTVKNGAIDSSIKTSQVEKESTRAVKDVLQESIPLMYKKPKYRAKYRINALDMTKEEKVPQLKEIRVPKDFDTLPKYRCLSFTSSQTIRSSRSFNCFEKPAIRIYQDCRTKPLTYLQPTKHCKDLIPNNNCLGKPEYCDICTTSCFNLQNEAARNATLRYAHCRFPQNSCATKYHVSCHSLVDSHAYNINDCTKSRIIFENLLCTDAYYKKDAKCCCLNNIGNIQMGYYHCNDSCPVWNNSQHCDRARSYYWTKRNLYFTHPWTSEYLL